MIPTPAEAMTLYPVASLEEICQRGLVPQPKNILYECQCQICVKDVLRLRIGVQPHSPAVVFVLTPSEHGVRQLPLCRYIHGRPGERTYSLVRASDPT